MPPKIPPDLSFPWRLFFLLNDASSHNFQHIISWTDHGTAFQIKDTSQPLEQILGQYFNTSKYASFRRQLLNYGFVSASKRERTFLHPNFSRDKPEGCDRVEYFKKGHKLAATAIVTKKGQTIQQQPSPEAVPANDDDDDENDQDEKIGYDMEPIPLHQIQRISSEEDRPQYEPLTMPIPRLQSTTSWKFIHNLPSFRAPHPKPAYENLAVFPIKNNNNNDSNTAVGVSPSLSSKSDKITLSPSLPATATYQFNQLLTQTSYNEPAATTVSTPHSTLGFDVLDLEPRTILEMKIEPDTKSVASTIYSLWPTLSNFQQMVVEYAMPFSITGFFYMYHATFLALVVGSFLAILHTIEILSTNFFDTDIHDSTTDTVTAAGPRNKPKMQLGVIIPQVLNPVEHLLIDNLWMQMLFSTFFFFPQQLGGPYCVPLAISFLMTQPFNTTVSLKTHMTRQMQRQLQDRSNNENGPTNSHDRRRHAVCEYHFGRLIRDCIICYGIAAALLYRATREIPSMQDDHDNDVRNNDAIEGANHITRLAPFRWNASPGWIAVILFYMNCLPVVFGTRYMKIWNFLVSSSPSISAVHEVCTPPVASKSSLQSKIKTL
ncbi:HSF-type DNA-binding protein [Nitzschia inconspicua]|uniref:HSF-type DNA-binding protein n=1 Tax=Nitzschia inconspicua TaxID=303405 RepID=A0A9K3LPM6_9STRA|nr:HSF-type DNA-binding protein [Nitzschia inconspicua]